MRSLTTFPALFLLLLLLMAVTPVSIAWNANRPGQGPDPLSLPAVAAGDNATVLLTTVLQPSSHQDGDEVVADSIPAVDATAAYPDRVPGDDVTDVPSPDQPLTASDAASLSSDVDDGTEEDVSSSTSPVDDSTVVAPSRLSLENVDPSPQKSISADDAGSSNSTESLSAAQLKNKMNLAEGAETTAKDEVDKARQQLEKKKDEAIEPNREYEEKKQKWEELQAILDEKERPETEYNRADTLLNTLQFDYELAESDYKTVNESLKMVTDELAAMPNWPTDLLQEESKRDAKQSSKPSTADLESLRQAVFPEARKLRNIQKTQNQTKDVYETQKCAEPANENSVVCKGLVTEIARLQELIDQAQKDYDTAVGEVTKAEKKIEDVDRDLIPINARIYELQTWIVVRTPALLEKEKGAFETDQGLKKTAFDGAKTKRDEAAEEVDRTKTVKETADQSDGGLSIRNARLDAIIAHGTSIIANETKIAKDKEVTEAQNALTKAESSYKDAQAFVARLTDRYDVQKRKEDEAQRGSLGLIMGCIGGVLLLLVGLGVAGYLVWRKKGRRGEDHKDSKHRASTADTLKKTSNSLDN